MKFKTLVLSSAVAAALMACSNDDNDAEVRALQAQVEALQVSLNEASADNDADVQALQAQVVALQAALDSAVAMSDTDVAALEAEVALLEQQLAQLTATAPVLGANATTGANLLKGDQIDTLRIAIFPDTQGRDDDDMKMFVDVACDGSAITVQEYMGVDYNRDGYYDAGTESQVNSVSASKPAEDGISYKVDVSDPYHPCIVMKDGAPEVVAPEDRKDFGPDWKILPLPLVDAVTDKMIELDVDMVLATGDITEYRAESDYVMWMEHVAEPLKAQGISVFPARGNHEIVNGRNWPAWFTNTQEWERQSVNNVYNDINPYDGYSQTDFDQGYQLYKAYTGALVQEHLNSGKATGFPGAEDLVYYFVEDNTLFIAIDYYFTDITSTAARGTWLVLHDWLKDVISSHAESVDHIIAFGHEPISTKKRPQTFEAEQYDHYLTALRAAEAELSAAETALADAQAAAASTETLAALQVSVEEAQSAVEALDEPSIHGYDIGQLGYMMLQDEASPGLAESILQLFTDYKVTYFSGHDHQYARSIIHPTPDAKDSAQGFTQIIGGNASWKAYEDLYGMHDDHETGLFINNFYDTVSGGNLVNSLGQAYASVTSDLGNGISFVMVEINGREISTTAYHADHSLTEIDMNFGAHYRSDSNEWCTYSGDFMVEGGTATTEDCQPVVWQALDENTRTTDATVRVVKPDQNYFAYSETPEGQGYIGSAAAIIDGYNITFNSSYAATINRVERLRELLSLSWYVDEDATTVSDVLLISGNHTQEGSYFDQYGTVSLPVVDVDGGVLAEGESPSLSFVNRNGYAVSNPTHTTRDGIFNKGIYLDESLNPAIPHGNPGGNDANWNQRYLDDGLDFADAMTIQFTAPEGMDITDLTLARFDDEQGTWEPILSDECLVETGYSDHMSVHYRISEQHPESGYNINNCQQRYWGYIPNSNTLWGFVHSDGKFALIER